VEHNGTVKEQLSQLWTELNSLRADLRTLGSDTRQEVKDLSRRIVAFDNLGMERHQEITRRVEMAEQQQTQFNAMALPLIGFGIVLSGLAQPIAQWPLVFNVALLVLIVGFSAQVVVPILRRAHN
jgi:hypothetical protein